MACNISDRVKALNGALKQQREGTLRTQAAARTHTDDMETEETDLHSLLHASTDNPILITGPSRTKRYREHDGSVGVEQVKRLQKEERKLEEMKGRSISKLMAFHSMKCFGQLASRLEDDQLQELLFPKIACADVALNTSY